MNKLTFIIIYYDWDCDFKFKSIETTSLKEGLEKCEEEINNLTTQFFNVNIYDEKGLQVLPTIPYKTLLLMKEYLK